MTTNHNHHRQHVGTLKENLHIMRKSLTTFAIGAIVATTLVACGTESDSDSDIDSNLPGTQIGERVPEGVEVVDSDIPVAYSHLAGPSAPDSVGVICVGDHAFLYTWNRNAYSGGSGATRFMEQDEMCADIQVNQE